MNVIDGQMMKLQSSGSASGMPSVESLQRKAAGDDAGLREVCEEFEALFLKQMLDSMRKSVEKSGLMGGGMAEDIFEDLLYSEYSKVMAKTGRFGIADMLYSQMSTTPGVTAASAASAYRD